MKGKIVHNGRHIWRLVLLPVMALVMVSSTSLPPVSMALAQDGNPGKTMPVSEVEQDQTSDTDIAFTTSSNSSDAVGLADDASLVLCTDSEGSEATGYTGEQAMITLSDPNPDIKLGQTAQAAANVSAGDLAQIEIIPALGDVPAGGTQQFTAQGYDSDNQPVLGPKFDWNTDLGFIDDTGLFSAPHWSGTVAHITVTCDDMHAEAVAKIVAGALDHIDVSPALTTIPAGGTRVFSAQGYDAANNLVPDVKIDWITNVGFIDEAGLFHSGRDGRTTGYVRAVADSIYGEARVNILSDRETRDTLMTVATRQFQTSTADAYGSISGHVYQDDGVTPIPNAWVYATGYFTEAGNYTEPDGSYSLVLPTGTYRVAVNSCPPYAGEYYDNVYGYNGARRVSVIAPDDTPNIDFILDVGGIISGHVYEEDGITPISGMTICASDYNKGVSECGSTLADGSYTLVLPSGTYIVKASGSAQYASEYYNNAYHDSEAIPVSVTAPNETPNIDFVLELGGTISGHVYRDDGITPIPGFSVHAIEYGTGDYAAGTSTDSDGSYIMVGLRSGSYLVQAYESGSPYVGEYYDDTFERSMGTPVLLTAGDDTPNIDFSLGLGGSISGVVTDDVGNPLAEAQVWASQINGTGSGEAYTAEDGSYTICGLQSGRYHVYAETPDLCYISEYYDNIDNIYDRSAATPVFVAAPNDTPSIDLALDLGGSISGVVTDEAGKPLAGVWVWAEEQAVWWDFGDAYTAGDGSYTICGLHSGIYCIYTESADSCHIFEYYDNVYYWSAATFVRVAVPNDTPNIDFSLGLGGSISGVVTDDAGNPLVGAVVVADEIGGTGYNYAYTAADGGYTICGLYSGSYRVEASGKCYIAEYYDNVYDSSVATPIYVNAPIDTPDVDFALGSGGSISGVVTDEAGNPLVGAHVRASPIYGSGSGDIYTTGDTYTAGDGSYTICGLCSGSYRVWTETRYSRYIAEYYHDVYDYYGYNAASPVLVTAPNDTPSIDFALELGGSISGAVTDNIGNPLVGAELHAGRIGGGGSRFAYTAGDGTYKICGLRSGSYRVYAGASDYLTEYYNNVDDSSAATPVAVNAGNDTHNIDFSLGLAGSISGVVTDDAGNPLVGVEIEAYWIESGGYNSDYTGGDGSYTISGLRSGSYRVYVDDYDPCYFFEYYDNVYDRDAATPVSVTAPDDTPNIDFSLGLGGSISGVVTDDAGNPLVGVVEVEADQIGGPGYGYAYTAGDGGYTICGLRSGSYRVEVYPYDSCYLAECYDNVYDSSAATPVTVTASNDTPNIDFSLGLGGSISGVVTDDGGNPLVAARVSASRIDGGGGSSAYTVGDGSYTICGLHSGSYRVRAYPSDPCYFAEYYDNVYDSSAASPVSVTAPNDTPNIDFSLGLGGSISGVVTDDAGNPLVMAQVQAYWIEGGEYYYTYTAGDGSYTICGLQPCSYRVYARASDPRYVAEYYDNVYDYNAATPVLVTARNDTSVDFSLGLGGSISGVVTDDAGNPFVRALVYAYPTGFGYQRSAYTTRDGSYTICGLRQGSYEVYARASDPCYLLEYYDNVYDSSAATPVPVTAPNDTPNIDFSLGLGGSVSGVVTNDAGNPLAGAQVRVVSGYPIDYYYTAADGTYTICGLYSGSYVIQASALESCYLAEYYDNTYDYSATTPVSVTAPNDTPNIDFSLGLGGSVSGVVTDDAGNPLPGAQVWVAMGGPSNLVYTGADGTYTICGLQTGNYSLCARASDLCYLLEYYDNVYDWSAATSCVSVTAPNDTLIDFSLGLGGSISGVITDDAGNPLVMAQVQAHWIEGGKYDTAYTAGDGSYTICGLHSGSYHVSAQAADPCYLLEYYDNVYDSSAATPVSVTAPNDTLTDFSLGLGGSISGVVTDDAGNPLVMAQVQAHWIEGGGYDTAYTAGDGSYTICGLHSGSYHVCAQAADPCYLLEYYDNVYDSSAATPVSVTAPNDTPNIDFSLGLGGSISGVVTDDAGNPLVMAQVQAHWIEGGGYDTAYTAGDGGYTICGLCSGSYRVWAYSLGPCYVVQYYDNVYDSSAATPVLVTVPNDTADIDFSLIPTPPEIYSHVPSGVTQGPIKSLTFNFDLIMNETSFSITEDIVTFTGPSGNLVPHITGFTWKDSQTLEVAFDQLSTPGEYEMVIGPDIISIYGAAMDQDGDLSPGEILDDLYIATFIIGSPRVLGHTPAGTMIPPVGFLRFNFNQAMNEASFSITEDIVSFTGPSGNLTPHIAGFTWKDSQTLEVTFDQMSTLGEYEMVIGPDIISIAGSPMDQDNDLVVGEIPDDQYSGAFVLGNYCTWSGDITDDTTWDCEIYLVDGPVTVISGVTLTIPAGTVVKLNDIICIQGKLEILGTPEQTVILTSWCDDTAGGDTNGDGALTSPAPGDWLGLTFRNRGAVHIFENVEIRYSWTAIATEGIAAPQSNTRITLDRVTFDNNNLVFYTADYYSDVEAENCLIIDNSAVMYIFQTSRLILRNCTIIRNGSVGLVGQAILQIANSIIAHNTYGINGNPQPGDVTIWNSIFYDQVGEVVDWVGEEVFYENRNIVTDPLLANLDAGDYELTSGSAAIDSARGANAPGQDILGRPRHDDLGIPNKGTGCPAYVDMGAFERQKDTMSGDLSITYVSEPAPDSVSAGDSFAVEWTVANIGTANCTTPWQDRVYLSDDSYISPDDLLIETLVHDEVLNSGESYTSNITSVVPSTAGPKYVLVYTNANRGTPEANLTNNLGSPRRILAVDVPLLELNTPVSGTMTWGQWDFYRFDSEAGNTVSFSLDAETMSGSTGLYLRYLLTPTVSEYDAAGVIPGQPDQEASLLEPQDGVYYVGVYGRHLPSGSAAYTLSAQLTDLDIRDVIPDSVGDTGQATLEVMGDNLAPDNEFHLLAPDGVTEVSPVLVYYSDPSTVFATFDFAGADLGEHDIVVVTTETEIASLPDALNVTAGIEPEFEASLSMPGTARPGRVINVPVEYTNTGNVDIGSPMLMFDSNNPDCRWQVEGGDEWIEGSDFNILALSSDGPVTVLRPGQTCSINVKLHIPFQPGRIEVQLSSIGAVPMDGSSNPIDWEDFEAQIRPEDVDPMEWDPVFAQLRSQIGDTWGDYVSSLRENAERFFAAGKRVYSARKLFGMEMDKAYGLPTGIIAGQVIDGDSGHPVPNAVVSGRNIEFENYAESLTDANGAFLLYGLDAGECRIRVGRHLVLSEQTLVLPTEEDLIGVQVLVTEAGHLRGFVTDAHDGTPLADAIVSVAGVTSNATQIAMSNEYGYYEFGELPDDLYRVECFAEGYTDLSFEDVSISLATTRSINFAMVLGGAITGRVTRASDGVELEGALGIAYGNNTGYVRVSYTDANGFYQIIGLAQDDYTVTVSLSGYLGAEESGIAVTLGSIYDGLDFSLAPGAAISGTVTDTAGMPIQDAAILAQGLAGSSGFEVTNETGEYSITELGPGIYIVYVEADGYVATNRETEELTEGGSLVSVDFQLQKGIFVEGTVIEEDGAAPIAGAELYFRGNDGTAELVVTEGNGSFSVDTLRAGVYYLQASADGYCTVQKMIYVPEYDGIPDLSIALPTGIRLAGTVTTSDEVTHVQGASVQLRTSSNASVASAFTDANGQYAFYSVPTGSYSVAPTHSEYCFVKKYVNVSGASDVICDFSAAESRLSGVIRSAATMDPLSNATVTVILLNQELHDRLLMRTETDSSGFYSFNSLTAGDYLVIAQKDDFGRGAKQQIIDVAGNVELDFDLQASLRLGGVVQDSKTSLPIENAAVWLVNASWKQYDTGLSGSTGADGVYSISGVSGGEYVIRVWADGYVIHESDVTISADSEESILLSSDGHTLLGRVIDHASGLPIAGAGVFIQNKGVVRSAQTDIDGEFNIGHLSDGLSRLDVAAYSAWNHSYLSLPAEDEIEIYVDIPNIPNQHNSTLLTELFMGRLQSSSCSEKHYYSVGASPFKELPNPPSDPKLLSPAEPCKDCPTECECPLEWCKLQREKLDRDRETIMNDAKKRLPQMYDELMVMQQNYEKFDKERWKTIKDMALLLPKAAISLTKLGKLWDVANVQFYVDEARRELGEALTYWIRAKFSTWESKQPLLDSARDHLQKSMDNLREAGKELAGLVNGIGEAISLNKMIKLQENLSRIDAEQSTLIIEYWRVSSAYCQLVKAFPFSVAQYKKGLEHYMSVCHCEEEKDPEDSGKDHGGGGTDAVTSVSPEDKWGPSGYDEPETPAGSEKHYVRSGEIFDYRIEIWNKPDAPAPTQDATIDDVLDPDIFDLSTFEFTRVGFLKWDVPLPGGQEINVRVDTRPDMNIAVDITGEFDPDTGEIHWWFHCVDPLTGDYPEDPMAGFLPPYNPETGFEIGWMEFRVKPNLELPSGTQIANQALVQFDFFGPWGPAPKEGPWINTIDSEPPSSEVADLPPVVESTSFVVSWNGTDDSTDSGIGDYDIYCSDNGGDFEPWILDANSTTTEATFAGECGHTYGFYSIATDNVGNVEDAPLEADATTTVIWGEITLIVVDAPDEVLEGSDFIADVAVDYVEDFNSCGFDVTYDQSIITATDVAGGEIDGHAIDVEEWHYIPLGTEDTGRIRVVTGVPGFPQPGVTGTGYIAEIHYQVLGSVCNTSSIHLENLAMYDHQAQEITTTTADDSVHVVAIPSLEITTTGLPDGKVGNIYSATLGAVGGQPPYTWGATGSPSGLSCSAAGVISGTPVGGVGDFTVTITVTDSFSPPDTRSKDLTLTISCKPGDVNTDSAVDTGDITKVKRIYFEMDAPTPCADVNIDGLIDTGDITAIRMIYFGAPA